EGFAHQGAAPLAPRRQEPSDQIPFVVGLVPPDGVPELSRPTLHRLHDLGERLGSVGLGLTGAERAQVGTEQVQQVHAAAPISCRMRRTSASGTPSTTSGRPTSWSRTKRTPPWNFLSRPNALQISSTDGRGPSV